MCRFNFESLRVRQRVHHACRRRSDLEPGARACARPESSRQECCAARRTRARSFVFVPPRSPRPRRSTAIASRRHARIGAMSTFTAPRPSRSLRACEDRAHLPSQIRVELHGSALVEPSTERVAAAVSRRWIETLRTERPQPTLRHVPNSFEAMTIRVARAGSKRIECLSKEHRELRACADSSTDASTCAPTRALRFGVPRTASREEFRSGADFLPPTRIVRVLVNADEYSHHFDAPAHSPASVQHARWRAPRCGAQAERSARSRLACAACCVRRSSSGARHVQARGEVADPAQRCGQRRDSRGVSCRSVRPESARGARLHSGRSSAHAREGARRAVALARHAATVHPCRATAQSPVETRGPSLRRPIPRASAAHAARGPARARLRPAQCAQARSARARPRSVLVGRRVRWMERDARGVDGHERRGTTSLAASNVAAERRLAQTRTHSARRGSRIPKCRVPRASSSQVKSASRRRVEAQIGRRAQCRCHESSLAARCVPMSYGRDLQRARDVLRPRGNGSGSRV